ncbi:putative N-acyl-phosphatidylethanolamine-hydrolyzing phospholipase D [Suhomyces tanzawaensis NRRL Y-17324]|uniref:Putative N-acyl-phosphatidylethanolamine-hydrolyzing phospholipase D n=1 Tax=Suhomyces tanzawaensis NRRL Y-17324 TaxID=984487 RepID=A0A1E4SLL3_9ASCO|nr:putative N-acyl-phosphatidylethanolamine-hydrolyzing phospholipase D [Suhomyces tanzawaensis NRRL Y-17324]ODV80399.1 putative N-acyl-phosphatidylethanolamine-hydrolyzing phospholipase D [Suhomyces tanzawaensis NRRL Y-17324]
MGLALSLKSKLGLGLLLSYTSFEVFMQVRTKHIISLRRQEVQKLSESTDISKFRSATVAGMFINPFDEYRPQTAFEFILVRFMEFFESIYGNEVELHDKVPGDEEHGDVEGVLKAFTPNLEYLRKNSQILQACAKSGEFKQLMEGGSKAIQNQLLFTWLGQSCSLVQVAGINFLTDPIMSDHLISQSIGPKRFLKSPLSYDDIKYATNDKIDYVLVSHDHPDHLELDFAKQIGNTTTWIVPLGLKLKLARKGIYKVIEMDWWDTIPLDVASPDKYEVVCVPAMHWSGRYVFDSNKSLWCSFIIRRNGESLVYHAGDTGYLKDLFKVLGHKYGPIQLGLLPIGQYCPSWHQKPRHISPQESLQICADASIKFMKGIHWGTFKLSSEPILEPKYLLDKYAEDKNRHKVPEFGLTYLFNLKEGTEEELHVHTNEN